MSSSTDSSERRRHHPITSSGLLNLRTELLRTEQLIANHKSTTTTSKLDPFTFANNGKNKKLDSKFINLSSSSSRNIKERHRHLKSSRKRSRSPSTSNNKKRKRDIHNAKKDCDSHDNVDWERIQSSLMYKQRVYNYLTATGDVESVIGDGSSATNTLEQDGPLVDFVSKRYDKIMAQRKIDYDTSGVMDTESLPQYDDKHNSLSSKPIITTRNPFESSRKIRNRYLSDKDISDTESLMEIEDEFGRTRRVPRTDITQYLPIESHDRDDSSNDDTEFLYPPPPPIHYDANREVRDRGAGFYQLAQDDGERIRQQNDLLNLRHETKLKRQERALELGLSSSTQLDAVQPSLLHNDPTLDPGLTLIDNNNPELFTQGETNSSPHELDPHIVRRIRLIMRRRVKLLGRKAAEEVKWAIQIPIRVYEDILQEV